MAQLVLLSFLGSASAAYCWECYLTLLFHPSYIIMGLRYTLSNAAYSMWICIAFLNWPCCCLFFSYGGVTLLIPIFFLLTIPPLLIVGLMKVIPLCRRYTGTLSFSFLFSWHLSLKLFQFLENFILLHDFSWSLCILSLLAFARSVKIWHFGQACLHPLLF